MTREFSADNLVALPKLSTDSGLALWQAIRAAVSAEKKLPKFLQSSFTTVEQSGTALFAAAQAQLLDSSTKHPAEKRKADSVVDNAVGALDQFLAAWERLPSTVPEAQVAAATRHTLFPDGTAFLKLPFSEEWAQIERRLTLLKSQGLDKQIAKLGGTAFVSHLEEAHAAYGKALGLTTVPAALAEPVTVRSPLAALESALRTFVIKVTAYRDDEDPETLALSERLLRPLALWSSKASKADSSSEPAPVVDPEPAAPKLP
jgi:hypothetical protein